MPGTYSARAFKPSLKCRRLKGYYDGKYPRDNIISYNGFKKDMVTGGAIVSSDGVLAAVSLNPSSFTDLIAKHAGAGYITAHRGKYNEDDGGISKRNRQANHSLEKAIRGHRHTYTKIIGVGQEGDTPPNTEHTFVILKPRHWDHDRFTSHLLDLANHVPGHEQHSFVQDVRGTGHLVYANDAKHPRGASHELGRITAGPHGSRFYAKLHPHESMHFGPEDSIAYVNG